MPLKRLLQVPTFIRQQLSRHINCPSLHDSLRNGTQNAQSASSLEVNGFVSTQLPTRGATHLARDSTLFSPDAHLPMGNDCLETAIIMKHFQRTVLVFHDVRIHRYDCNRRRRRRSLKQALVTRTSTSSLTLLVIKSGNRVNISSCQLHLENFASQQNMIKFVFCKIGTQIGIRSSRTIGKRERGTANHKMLTRHQREMICFSPKKPGCGTRLTKNLPLLSVSGARRT